MTEIIPGIYQLKVPIPNNPLGNTNSYLLRGDDGALIIDPGMNNDESFEALQKELTAAGVAFGEITRIVATHAHGDHYGLSGRVKKLSNAEIIVHRIARDTMQLMSQHRQGRNQEMEKWLLLNGVPPSSDPAEFRRGPPRMANLPEPTMPDVLLQGDETITVGGFNLKVLFTPGHEPGHICLYESTNKILFSGDHVLPVITPSVGLQTESGVNPLGDFLNSLNRVKQLDVRLVLPAHEQTFTNLRERVDEIIAHHEHRNWEIMEALNSKPKTAYEISQKITWMPYLGGKKFKELGPWDKRMAVMETLAHLKVMKEAGKVGTFSRNSTIYYKKTDGLETGTKRANKLTSRKAEEV